MKDRVKRLPDLPLERLQAHGGDGEIGFHRVFEAALFESPCNFVDYAEIPPGASIGRHRHGDDEEIYLVLDGDGVMTLDDESLEVSAGSVIVNRRNGVHGLRNVGDRPLRLFVVEVALA